MMVLQYSKGSHHIIIVQVRGRDPVLCLVVSIIAKKTNCQSTKAELKTTH